MLDELKEAIIRNAKNSADAEADNPDCAMKYAQAALNLAHAIAVLKANLILE